MWPTRAPSLRFGGAPAERGENPPISARGTRSWSFRIEHTYEPVPGPGTAIPVLIHSSISDLGVSLIFPSLLCGEVFDITRERGTA